jgi:hypothetical protein
MLRSRLSCQLDAKGAESSQRGTMPRQRAAKSCWAIDTAAAEQGECEIAKGVDVQEGALHVGPSTQDT